MKSTEFPRTERILFPAILAVSGLLALAAMPLLAQTTPTTEPEADPAELPRIPATEPDRALATFEVRPGFRLELAAHEPLVMDPIAVDFDEKGGLFVVEMRGYSEHREEALGRIKRLTDENDDGVFDTATVYAEGLKWPTAVTCFDGGVFVCASPDIFYLKDTDGDGVSDTRETVFTGFGSEATRLNMQALVNSLRWGPDNRVWGATAGNGGTVRRPDQPESEAISLRGADFSFDPRKRDLRAENGTAQYGMSFDSLGRRFVCSNSNHIQWVAWERQWLDPNPFFSPPKALVSIAEDGAAAPVFRVSPDEPWRIVRTRWRVSGVVKGVVEGGGRVSGYFTAATGITLYTGDAYGPAFADNAFIGDAGSNLVHRKILSHEPGATQPVARRAADEAGTEFVRSRDNWFRPVSFANGPDGCLYICDMYRETIEHPWSIPEGIKKYVDLDSGNDRGRIWRVVPEGFQRPKFSLDRDNLWQKIVRSRLAYEAGRPVVLFDPKKAVLAAGGDDDPWSVAFRLNELRDAAAMTAAWPGATGDFRVQLAEMIGKTGDPGAIQPVLDTLVRAGVGAESGRLLASLGNGLRAANLTVSKVDPDTRLAAIFDAARSVATDPMAPAADRRNALDLLAFDTRDEAGQAVTALVADSAAPEALRQAAIAVASRRAPGLADLLIGQWPGFSATLRAAALDALNAKPDRALALLEAIGAGKIAAADIPPNTAELLRASRDAQVKALAAKILPAPEVVPRGEIVARYQGALKLAGDAARGATVYRKACVTCHKSADGQGFNVGPEFATIKTAGADSILKNLFDPNAEVAPQYQAFVFTLHSGEAVMGLIATENATEVTVRMPGGVERAFLRKEVASMLGVGKSLMPEGLEATLTEQDVADLLAYIAR
ncbi:MAG: c-type cytochrome [Akkermansiaceae bacterium]|nr:c-type cytochrome [Akkermansiaceae bacterium]